MRDTDTGQDEDAADTGAAARQAAAGPPHPPRARRLTRSPLARKIIVFNLIGLLILIGGVLFLDPFRDSLAAQRSAALQAEARLIADALALQLPQDATALADGPDPAATLARLDLSQGVALRLYAPDAAANAAPLAEVRGPPPDPADRSENPAWLNILAALRDGIAARLPQGAEDRPALDGETLARSLLGAAAEGASVSDMARDGRGHTLHAVATPVRAVGGQVAAVLTLSAATGEVDALVRDARRDVLQVFALAILVSVGLSLVLASTIANPLADLAAATETGRDRSSRQATGDRVRIPDLSDRSDEIGRLSVALRGMLSALYDRIDANEQFAADVAHEIKNPLASLRSAVGTLRIAGRPDQREKLLDVIDHDVRRLDRLVSDISNASRLDSELVKEAETRFDLLKMLRNLSGFLAEDAQKKGIEVITDLPHGALPILGLEARLAQVFVNLIGNAVSFCEAGDAVRLWVRRREDRVLIVVEDTGPGIPEGALGKVFDRFYSERPPGQFGDHSGLGLAISKQIVDAHDGVIWAENIRPTAADATSEPLGARFVVGLPV